MNFRRHLGRKTLLGLFGAVVLAGLVYWLNPSTSPRATGPGSGDAHDPAVAGLSQLGYLSGYEPAPAEVGLVLYDRRLAEDGYNFYTSAHAPKATLMDMQGKVLHTWHYPYQDDWPQHVSGDEIQGFEQHTHFWRRAALLPNGDLLAIFEGRALLKIDQDSNLLWAYRGGFHHDLDVTGNGLIHVLTRRLIGRHEAIPEHEALVEDFITVLTAEGRLIRRVSLLEAFLNSPYRELFLERLPLEADVMHTNTLEVLRGSLAIESEAFREGNVLVCLRNLDLVAVVDLERQSVVWALDGDWKMPHQPTLLDNGNLLVFDNQGGNGGFSKVIEFNPRTEEVLWSFEGNAANDFFSKYAGSCQRLARGNTLITDSLSGKVFEVTPDHEMAWGWVNVERSGQGKEFIAVVYEMIRLSHDDVKAWLK